MSSAATQDVVELLDRDHRTVEQRFAALANADPQNRASKFTELVHLLVGHEVAEEITIYPTIRSEAPNGKLEADARLQEQAEAEEKLAVMEKMDPTGSEFVDALAELRSAVLEHAHEEEQNIFPLLRALEGKQERKELGVRYQKAKAAAPTHPHPHAPDTPPGNAILGPIAAIFDKARDAARNA